MISEVEKDIIGFICCILFVALTCMVTIYFSNKSTLKDKAAVQSCWDRGGTALIVDNEVMCSK
jgi:hypothetical protein